MRILVVTRNSSGGNMFCVNLQDVMGTLVSNVELVFDPKEAFNAYVKMHPDVLIIEGFSSGYSEALIINARNHDGKRHTGVIVMAPSDDHFNQLAVNNYNAGADDVIDSHISMSILRAKIITVFNHKLLADQLRTIVHKLEDRILTDELTGLGNMRLFMKKFALSYKDCEGGKTGVAVVMMDLDRFKKINDTMNHMVGSHVIKVVGRMLAKAMEGNGRDFACRYGGDEYILVLHGDDPQALLRRVDVIRSSIEQLNISFQEFHIRVTSSLGFCWAPQHFNGKPEDLVKGADAMLYKSKADGRNCASGMVLKYPVDFANISAAHLIRLEDKAANLQALPQVPMKKAR